MATLRFTEKQKEEMYLEYFNNFLTTDVFAEYYQISPKEAEHIIRSGRIINHSKYK
jgi:hypothetical protein